MLHRLNSTLMIIAIILGLIDGAYWAYCHYDTDISDSKIVRELGGDYE